MSEFVKSFELGKATVTSINIGEIYLPMVNHMNVPASEFLGRDDIRGFAEQTRIAIQFFHIQLPQTSILVDAGIYDVVSDPHYAIPDYVAPASLIDSLASVGIQAEDIEHVIITHAHWDHFNGTTIKVDGQYQPQFPNARYYLGRGDWDRLEAKRLDPETVEYRCLQVLFDQGRLELVEGDLDLVEGVQIIATPGETAGHQILRLSSEGQSLYCLGDLYHHAVELDHPEWAVSWASDAIFSSRDKVMKQAIQEQSVLVASHIIGLGRIKPADGHVNWTA